MKKYEHIFFDLDRTLWDFVKNSTITLNGIRKKFVLEEKIPDPDEFVKVYNHYNDLLWDRYRDGKIKKNLLRLERFRLTLRKFGIEDKLLTAKISKHYIDTCPVNPVLIGNARETLAYLHDKYRLYIISNGFYDVQLTKLINSGII